MDSARGRELGLACAANPVEVAPLRPRLADLLVCPVDGGALELVEWESSPARLSDEDVVRVRRMGLTPERFEREVRTGLLVNRRRHVYYPIVEGVPRLLVFPTGVVRDFARRYRNRLAREATGYGPPAEDGAPGEEAVLRSFSSEWLHYEWDERAYWSQSAEDMFRTMNFALDLEHKDLRDRLVLEVGIGIGGIADYVARSQQCELVGVDLSHAVDGAWRQFGANPFFHVVQASAFAPPFADGQFEYVYTQGVLHHTYSTRAAFKRISTLPRVGGRLYVWVYSQSDERRTPLRRLLYALEAALRPVYSRLPDPFQTIALAPWAPLYIAHQRLAARGNPHYTTYGWREAMHAARDRWTPRYVHRHTDEQVSRWFRAAGYDGLTVLSQRQAPDFVPDSISSCVGVEGVRLPVVATEGQAAG